jgi:hypothetical protein
MSSGGGGSGGSSTTTQELPGWAQPYAQELAQRGESLSNTSVPTYGGQTVAGLSGTQQGGIANTQNATQQAQNIGNQAQNWATGVTSASGPSISNPYTGNVSASTAANAFANPANNPYLAASVNASNQQITDAYNNSTAPTTLAQFRNAGAFGGSAQDQYTGTQEKQLATSLANNTANMYNGAYNTAAGVASQNAAQQNAVGLANQAVGTNANNAYNQNVSSNYFQNGYLGNAAIGTAVNANNAYGTNAGALTQAGGLQQQNNQDQLNAMYQQWYNQVNQPYGQLSTLSSALSGSLGSGAGTSVSTSKPGSGSTLGTALGLGQLGLGAYGAMQQ